MYVTGHETVFRSSLMHILNVALCRIALMCLHRLSLYARPITPRRLPLMNINFTKHKNIVSAEMCMLSVVIKIGIYDIL